MHNFKTQEKDEYREEKEKKREKERNRDKRRLKAIVEISINKKTGVWFGMQKDD